MVDTRSPVVRDAEHGDLPAILAIYNEVVATTTAVYSDTPTTLDERRHWFEQKRSAGFPVMVAAVGGDVLGFGTFGEFRAWPCYRHTVEHSVHIRADARSQGIGRTIVSALVERATTMGAHVMIAGIDVENAASLRLHQALGFELAGTLSEVGRKFDRWLDLAFLQRRLADSPSADVEAK